MKRLWGGAWGVLFLGTVGFLVYRTYAWRQYLVTALGPDSERSSWGEALHAALRHPLTAPEDETEAMADERNNRVNLSVLPVEILSRR